MLELQLDKGITYARKDAARCSTKAEGNSEYLL